MDSGDVPQGVAETLAVFQEGQVRGEPLTTSEVAESLDCSRRSAYDRLDRLADRGDVQTKKVGARGRVWWRPTDGAASGSSEPTEDLELYETVLETIWDGVYALDADERFVMANGAFLEMTGYDRQELMGEHASILHDEPLSDTARELAAEADESGGARLEHSLLTADGETIPVETRFGPYRFNDERGARAGIVRDVSDRRERERALAESERRYRAVTEHFPNGIVGLFDDDLRFLLADGQILDEFDVSREDLEGSTIFDLFDAELTETLEPNFRRALAGERSSFEAEYENRTLQVRTLPVSDDGDVFAGLVMTQDVTERRERERTLERQRERLDVLNNLNAVIRQINEVIVTQSTREEIQRTVCESLADADSYEFAWIAEVDPRTDTLTPRVEAGVDGYLDLVSLMSESDGVIANGPGSQAVADLETQVVCDVFEDPRFEPFRDIAREHGYSAVAAIPIVHEETLYGLIGVYADREDAFAAEERDVVARLGEMVGHAIAAVERKRALMSDELTEVEFRIPDVFDALDVEPTSTDGTVTVERTVPVGDDTYLQYGTTEGGGAELVRAFADQLSHWEDVIVVNDGFEGSRFELRLTDPPLVSTVAGLGGHVEEARIDAGDYHMAVHLPPTVDVRQIVKPVQESYPRAEMVTRRQVSRPEPSSAMLGRTVAERLTDRQTAALEAAFYSGFFEWPRNRSGQEIADTLDVTPATFHQHLREAERKILEDLFAGNPRLAD